MAIHTHTHMMTTGYHGDASVNYQCYIIKAVVPKHKVYATVTLVCVHGVGTGDHGSSEWNECEYIQDQYKVILHSTHWYIHIYAMYYVTYARCTYTHMQIHTHASTHTCSTHLFLV